MARSLRRSQHHQRRKEHKVTTEIGLKGPSNVALFPVPASQATMARNSHWTPWVLDSKGLYYWSALRRADGSLEYAYCDARGQPIGQPIGRQPETGDMVATSASASTPEIHNNSIVSAMIPPQPAQRPVSSAGFTAVSGRSVASEAAKDMAMRIAASSYVSLWYQDLEREGPSVGEKRKLDLKIHRWLAAQA